MEPREARRPALAAFGGLDRHRERLREGREIPVLEPLWRDARFAVRSLIRNPGLSLVAALTIALGVGATTAVFTLVDWALFEPLPIPGVERLVSIQEERSGVVSTGVEGMRIPYARYEAYRDATDDVFEALTAYRQTAFSLRLSDATIPVQGSLTSGTFFRTLAVEPVRGRAYTDDFTPEVVISHDLWTDTFGGDPGVVGRGIHVDGRPVTIVGAAPPDFRGTTVVPESIWVPAGIRGPAMHDWDSRIVPLGRIREDESLERATAAVTRVAEALPDEENSRVDGVALQRTVRMPGEERGWVAGFLGMLLGMALVVLLIAAANIAGVLVARATGVEAGPRPSAQGRRTRRLGGMGAPSGALRRRPGRARGAPPRDRHPLRPFTPEGARRGTRLRARRGGRGDREPRAPARLRTGDPGRLLPDAGRPASGAAGCGGRGVLAVHPGLRIPVDHEPARRRRPGR